MIEKEVEKSDIFQFKSFKIDSLELEAQNNIGLLKKTFDQSDDFNYALGFPPPMYIEEQKEYIVRLAVRISDKEQLVKVSGIITGLFSVEERLDPDKEKTFVVSHAPAIILPYIRSALTNLFASAGYGCVVLPLINLTKMISEKSDYQINVLSPEK